MAWEQQRRQALFALGHDPERAAHAAGAPRPAPEEPQGAAFFQERGRGLRQATVLFALHVALHAGLFTAIIEMAHRRAARNQPLLIHKHTELKQSLKMPMKEM